MNLFKSSQSSSTRRSSNNTTKPLHHRLSLIRKRTSTTSDCTDSSHSIGTVMSFSTRMLQFAAHPEVHEIEHVHPDDYEDVWYPMDYLQATRKEEIKNNLRAQYFQKDNNASSAGFDIEEKHPELTWRGMEDIREKYNKKQKVYTHVSAVLQKQDSLKHPLSDKAQASLRTLARTLSKHDRHKAKELAAQDAKLDPHAATSSPPSTRPLQAISKSFTKTVRRSLSPASELLSGHSHRGHSPSRGAAAARHHRKTNSLDLFNWKFSSGSGNGKEDVLSTRTMDCDNCSHTEQQDSQ